MSDDKQRIIERVRKLLALASEKKNDSIEEAASAAAKAQELMEKYSIEEAMLGDGSKPDPDITKRVIWQGGGEQSGKIATWLIQLASGICEVNRCRMWHRSMRQGRPGCITACGTADNIDRVQMMLNWLVSEVDRLYIEERPGFLDRSQGKRWGNAFRLGASSTIIKRLHEAMKKARDEMQNNTGAMTPEDANRYRLAIEQGDIETVLKMDSMRKRYLPAMVQTAIAKLDSEMDRVNLWVSKNQKLRTQKRNFKGTYEAGYKTGQKAGERARLSQER